MTTDLTPAASPFDALMRVDDRGEHWLARDLMGHFDYARWTEVRDGIERASIAITNSLGISAAQANVEACLNNVRVGFGERAVDDFRLSRYGAYMWAMVSDPRKKAVAEAQTYFAVKTREAEKGTHQTSTPALPQTYADALRHLLASVEREEEAKAALAIAAPAAEAFHVLAEAADNELLLADAAKALSNDPLISIGQNNLFKLLNGWDWIYRQGSDGKWRAMQYAVERGWLTERLTSYTNPRTEETVVVPQVRITPKGIAAARKRLLSTPAIAA